MTLIIKWMWQWARKEHKLWKSIFHELYMQRAINIKQSFFFKHHLKSVIPFCQSFIRSPENGSTIDFWHEKWGCGIMASRFSDLYSFSWLKEIYLQQMMPQQDISEAFRLILSHTAANQLATLMGEVYIARNMLTMDEFDDAIWNGQLSTSFLVKSAYYSMKNVPGTKSTISMIWQLNAPPRFRIFGWLLLLNRVLTTENLNKRVFSFVSICYLCRASEETSVHLFNECVVSKQVYQRVECMLSSNQHSYLTSG